MFVGGGGSSGSVGAPAPAARADPVFGWRSHHDEPKEFGVGGYSEFSAAVGFGESVAVSAGAVVLVGEEAVAPAGFVEMVCAETFRAGDAFEGEVHFGVGDRDFELDGIVAVVLGHLSAAI